MVYYSVFWGYLRKCLVIIEKIPASYLLANYAKILYFGLRCVGMVGPNLVSSL